LVGSCEYSLPCHKPALSASPPQEDVLRTPNGNKPNVSYFRVFGSKCYILVKRGRHSKFAPKAVEGFLLRYDSNTNAYRVFNKSLGLVEVSSDVVFDETNGSPREQVDLDDVDEDEVLMAAMRTMAISDVRP
jgi:hypothetical protein